MSTEAIIAAWAFSSLVSLVVIALCAVMHGADLSHAEDGDDPRRAD